MFEVVAEIPKTDISNALQIKSKLKTWIEVIFKVNLNLTLNLI